MSSDTADLIEQIDAERERTKAVLDEADAQVKEADAFKITLENTLKTVNERIEEALSTLERSGLLRRRVV